MKIGDLVKRDFWRWRAYYQITEIYFNSYGAKRLSLLNLYTGTVLTDIRPSHVKVIQ